MTAPVSAEFLALQQVLAGRYSIERELGRGGMGIVLLARELAITGLRAIASTEGLVMAAKDSGRYKTAFQLVGILCLVIHYTYNLDFLFFSAAG